jgi:hypothetical protein
MSRRVMFKPAFYVAGDDLADGILMTPTLVELAPSLGRRIFGTPSQTQPVLQALELETIAA